MTCAQINPKRKRKKRKQLYQVVELKNQKETE